MNLLLELGKLAIPVITQAVKNTITTKLEENVSQVAIKSLIAPAIDLVGMVATSALSTSPSNDNVVVENEAIPYQYNYNNFQNVETTRQKIMNTEFRYHI